MSTDLWDSGRPKRPNRQRVLERVTKGTDLGGRGNHKPGRPPHPPGRVPGFPNKITVDLKFAISEAAAMHGYDGNGLGALTGYCYMLAEREPKTFAILLRALLPLNVNARVEQKVLFENVAEAEAALKERGIPFVDIFKLEHHPDDVIENVAVLDAEEVP